jgi:hypothetical protein
LRIVSRQERRRLDKQWGMNARKRVRKLFNIKENTPQRAALEGASGAATSKRQRYWND